MIHLNLTIGDSDPQITSFENVGQFREYVCELKSFNCIWLLAIENKAEMPGSGHISVHEYLIDLYNYLFEFHFAPYDNDKGYGDNTIYFIQQYDSFEDAYSVALGMREPHPKCYN
jgi:hypothetical protein